MHHVVCTAVDLSNLDNLASTSACLTVHTVHSRWVTCILIARSIESDKRKLIEIWIQQKTYFAMVVNSKSKESPLEISEITNQVSHL